METVRNCERRGKQAKHKPRVKSEGNGEEPREAEGNLEQPSETRETQPLMKNEGNGEEPRESVINARNGETL